MNDHQDDKLYQEMRKSLDELDELYPTATPDLPYFENMVQVTKEQAKKRLRYDLLVFWCTAIIILSIMYVVQQQIPILYFIIQGLSLFTFIFILARKWGSRRDTTR